MYFLVYLLMVKQPEIHLCQLMPAWENIDVIHTYYILFYNATLDYITLSEYPRWYHVYLPGYTYLKLMAKYIIHSYLLHAILVFNIPKPRKVTL